MVFDKRKDNKRKAARFSVDIDGYYFYSNKWSRCRIYDLSLEGAGLRLNQFFIKDDIIKLKFGSETEQFVIDAKVVNINGPRIGIIFENLDDFDRESILKIINSTSKRYKM
ncbi:MAG: hypothetical protein A2086_10975 [Spirochaetes bacterium GWD1_27_9]|nr:MAG: hypothetical protein A2Z98_00055 [Spirochaetes bacterium GWB1_27_13]OHD20182.1 MAG: hypothetical protein A2Y34_05095 [Spirochaetes bacterium GWC1_27_15]OHD41274.1 MAG: hypothetical protein A2086_10975 [Spirochaetes bacterium GWD1_27_9]